MPLMTLGLQKYHTSKLLNLKTYKYVNKYREKGKTRSTKAQSKPNMHKVKKIYMNWSKWSKEDRPGWWEWCHARDERMECVAERVAIEKREGAKLRFEWRRRMRVFCCMGQNN
jgi:hypothetical protein